MIEYTPLPTLEDEGMRRLLERAEREGTGGYQYNANTKTLALFDVVDGRIAWWQMYAPIEFDQVNDIVIAAAESYMRAELNEHQQPMCGAKLLN